MSIHENKKMDLKPFFGSGILANKSVRSESGNLDCGGIITVFYAWAFPCVRNWQVLITLFNLHKGKTSITVSLKKKFSKSKFSLLMMDIEAGTENSTITVPIPLHREFLSEGIYELNFEFKDFPGKLKVPFEVRMKKWPIITAKELAFVKKRKEFIPKAAANIHCSKCKHKYVFEETIEESERTEGTFKFPEDGIFECEECGNILNLKDIQGQLRFALKDAIRKTMGGK